MAAQPQEAAPEHHRGAHQLRDHDAIAAHKREQRAGQTAEEKPGAQDFSIVMRAMQEPQQEDEEHELDQARVKLGRVQWHS